MCLQPRTSCTSTAETILPITAYTDSALFLGHANKDRQPKNSYRSSRKSLVSKVVKMASLLSALASSLALLCSSRSIHCCSSSSLSRSILCIACRHWSSKKSRSCACLSIISWCRRFRRSCCSKKACSRPQMAADVSSPDRNGFRLGGARPGSDPEPCCPCMAVF
jgi:hypothetical protein